MGKPNKSTGNEPNGDTGAIGDNGGQSIGQPGQDSGIGSDNSGPENAIDNGARDADSIAGKPVVKKRGRKPLPRDAAGNIIRDATEPGSGTKKAQLGLGAFVPNDRQKVRQNIQGMHGAVAVLTNQPVFALVDQEAIALTNALCDVLDYHQMNITEVGGVYGLYVTLAITVFGIYKPRVDILLSGDKVVGVAPSAPTTEGEAKFRASGMMDFGNDVKG